MTPAAGRVLVHCHAGCDYRDIVAALDLRPADLFDNPRGGIRFTYPGGRVVTRTSDKRFSQSGNPKEATLFGSDDIGNADTVLIVEGESDAINLQSAWKMAAVSPPMGASTRADRWNWKPLGR